MSSGFGGGIESRGTLALNDDVVTGNAAGTGGGIAAYFGSLTLNNTTVSHNTAAVSAGLFVQDQPATISNSTISSNHATDNTGGISVQNTYVSSAALTITNTTIANNTAPTVAAVRLIAGQPGAVTATFLNDTISGNTAANSGNTGGIGITNATLNATLTNTIVAGNTSGGSPADLSGIFNAASAYNLIGAGGNLSNGKNGNIVGVNNPLLAPLGNYGGPTQTMALLDGSPARKAGNPNVLVTTDQRGQPRTAGAVDLGAYQTQVTSTTLSSSSSTSDSGQSVTFTAVVTSTSAGTPTGSVTLGDRASPLAAGAPSGAVTLSDNVTALSTRTPSGAVTFFDNGTELGAATLHVVNGVDEATFTTSNLAVGDNLITATYDGDDDDEPSTASLTVIVDPDQIKNSNMPSPPPSASQQTPSLSAQLSEGIPTLLQGMSVFGELPLLLSSAGSLNAATDLFSSALDLVSNEVSLYVDVILGTYNQLLGLSTSPQGEQLAATIVGLVDALHANPLFNGV